MYSAAVVGEYDSIYGFAAVGLSTYPCEDAGEAEEIITRIAEENVAVIYVTESMAEKIQKTIMSYRDRMLPAIILIPGVSGNTGKGVENVKKSVEQAIGSDILFGDQ